MEEHKEVPPGFVDISSADPQIQKDYEVALGAFLLAFNQIESTVNDIIFLALQKSERLDIFKRVNDGSFNQKLTALDLISLSHPQALPKTVLEELRDLSGHRNILAHGHFHQNPFDGSYEIVTPRNRQQRCIPVTQLDQLSKRADRAFDNLRYADACFSFDDLDADENS